MTGSEGSQTDAATWRAGTLLVLLQLGLAAAIVLTTPWHHLGLPSTALIGVGVLLSAWAIMCIGPRQLSMRPELAPNARFVRSGPYRWIRHPMYLGLLLLTAGCIVRHAVWWRIGLWLLLCGVLDLKARREERYLLERFSEYQQYQKHTRRFVPWVY